MAWKVKEMKGIEWEGKELHGMAWEGKAIHGLERQCKARCSSRSLIYLISVIYNSLMVIS
jgi:hypothetical protein